MVAIDRAHAGNGCATFPPLRVRGSRGLTALWRLARRALNVLRGSHKLGRVDHSQQERGEMHADPEARPSPAPFPTPTSGPT